MLKKLLNGLLLLAIAVLPVLANSQEGPEGKWWHNPRVSKQLKLSNEEKAQLDRKFLDSRRRMIKLKGNVEREQLELQSLIESNNLDEGKAKNQFKRLEKARRRLSGERFDFLMQSRKVLGNERFQEIKNMYREKHRQKRQDNGRDRKGGRKNSKRMGTKQ
jgi:Spy/CpxP family protein refolding chaperone